jgi:hypothetical protein
MLSINKSVHDKSRLLEQDDKSLLGHGPSFNRTPLEQSISVSGSHNSKQIRDNYGDFNGELGKCENYAILGRSVLRLELGLDLGLRLDCVRVKS